MKRYQNPDVYERLALAYSLGTMHGRARKRFEKLMQQHPFLQAVVDEYDHKFAELVTYLPEEKPAEHVWKNIEAQLDREEAVSHTKTHLKPNDAATSWWHLFSTKRFITAMASLVLVVSLVFVNMTTHHTPHFACQLAAENQQVMFNALVSRTDTNMSLEVLPIGDIKVPAGKQMRFWCIPKDASAPIMNMGTISASGMQKPLTEQSWKEIESARMFGITFEPEGVEVTEPTGEFIYKGVIKAVDTPQSNA